MNIFIRKYLENGLVILENCDLFFIDWTIYYCGVLIFGFFWLGVCLLYLICLYCILGNFFLRMFGVFLTLILVLKVWCFLQLVRFEWTVFCYGLLYFLLCQKVCFYLLNCVQVQRLIRGCLELFCGILRLKVQVCLVCGFFRCFKSKCCILSLISFKLLNIINRCFKNK